MLGWLQLSWKCKSSLFQLWFLWFYLINCYSLVKLWLSFFSSHYKTLSWVLSFWRIFKELSVISASNMAIMCMGNMDWEKLKNFQAWRDFSESPFWECKVTNIRVVEGEISYVCCFWFSLLAATPSFVLEINLLTFDPYFLFFSHVWLILYLDFLI